MKRLLVVVALFIGFGTASDSVAEPPKVIDNSIGMKLVLIPAGKFAMGTPGYASREIEPEHEVTLSQPFYMGSCEVTIAQYVQVIGSNPNNIPGFHRRAPMKKRDQCPVDSVGWEDAVNFCKKLSELPGEKALGRVYRLPTEAEWEYACRAGSKSDFSCGDIGTKGDPDEYGDRHEKIHEYASISTGQGPCPVGEKNPNVWGLYDMHGNVREWCQDWYGDYLTTPMIDPSGPETGKHRVSRGGSWTFSHYEARSACRRTSGRESNAGSIDLGFRVVLTVSSEKSIAEKESTARKGDKTRTERPKRPRNKNK